MEIGITDRHRYNKMKQWTEGRTHKQKLLQIPIFWYDHLYIINLNDIDANYSNK